MWPAGRRLPSISVYRSLNGLNGCSWLLMASESCLLDRFLFLISRSKKVLIRGVQGTVYRYCSSIPQKGLGAHHQEASHERRFHGAHSTSAQQERNKRDNRCKGGSPSFHTGRRGRCIQATECDHTRVRTTALSVSIGGRGGRLCL